MWLLVHCVYTLFLFIDVFINVKNYFRQNITYLTFSEIQYKAVIATPQCSQIFGWAENNHGGNVNMRMWGTWCKWWWTGSVNSPITLYLCCFLLKGSSRPQRGLLMASRVASSSSPLGNRSFTRWKDLKTKQNPANLIRWKQTLKVSKPL